ncbi:hypothetical protein A4U53_016410 [Rhizobium ruizarguesonis]|uniref:Uncharacterized protein n=1 Tax=Rhizobium ruizarguesonis TaxID=2081791 RepID=A0ACD5ESN7_9HYPH
MKWLLDKIVSVIATRMATREIAALLSDIRSAGGSDVVCSKALAEIDGTPGLRKFVETSGIRNSLISIEASVLGVAAGNSIMAARRDLQTATDSAEVLQRLQMAQRAFVYSSLIFQTRTLRRKWRNKHSASYNYWREIPTRRPCMMRGNLLQRPL